MALRCADRRLKVAVGSLGGSRKARAPAYFQNNSAADQITGCIFALTPVFSASWLGIDEAKGGERMRDFAGKVAVITGAASGIGRAIAEWCVRADVKVVLADIETAALWETEAELEAMGGHVLSVRTNVAQRSDVEWLARRAFDEFGYVHLLFNNAGVAAGGTPWEATWNDWEWVMGVNLRGAIHGVKVFTPLMLAQNSECHIVNTASAAGLTAGGFSAPYSVTKHAVVALSECLYLALEQRSSPVKVSVLCPGATRTNIWNAERNRPEELKNEPAPRRPEMQAARASFEAVLANAMPPALVAEAVFEAIRNEQFYILSQPEWIEAIRLRTEKLLAMKNPENPMPIVMKLVNQQKAEAIVDRENGASGAAE
jgi:NAD(P)-dependent dehydrogenase (short-subunit alcohol dehydrogenase family)